MFFATFARTNTPRNASSRPFLPTRKLRGLLPQPPVARTPGPEPPGGACQGIWPPKSSRSSVFATYPSPIPVHRRTPGDQVGKVAHWPPCHGSRSHARGDHPPVPNPSSRRVRADGHGAVRAVGGAERRLRTLPPWPERSRRQWAHAHFAVLPLDTDIFQVPSPVSDGGSMYTPFV